jgi:hypothetical protein
VIIDNFNIFGSLSRPPETDPELIIDPDTPLPLRSRLNPQADFQVELADRSGFAPDRVEQAFEVPAVQSAPSGAHGPA